MYLRSAILEFAFRERRRCCGKSRVRTGLVLAWVYLRSIEGGGGGWLKTVEEDVEVKSRVRTGPVLAPLRDQAAMRSRGNWPELSAE